jgi:hypothetical protein
VWVASSGDARLTFRLNGINNQNFLMRDEQTGSWWQQVSGTAIRGPLKGSVLREVVHDELTFAQWKREWPTGRVLAPDPGVVEAEGYESADWEEQMREVRVVTPVSDEDPLPPRELVVGVTVGAASKAWPVEALREPFVILDELGGVPLALVLADDCKSVRVFDRRFDELVLELTAVPESWPIELVDAQTGTTWDFTGTAIRGPLAGKSLRRVSALPDYWFDWALYHPDTAVHVPAGT